MDMVVTFPGGKKVDATFDGMTVCTDQPAGVGGEGSAPTPFQVFLASLATCAGIFVLGFCESRGLPTKGIRIVQKNIFDPAAHRLSRIDISIELPKDFPAKYHDAVIRAADQCLVKRTIAAPPEMVVGVKVV
jgi:putative redox protein